MTAPHVHDCCLLAFVSVFFFFKTHLLSLIDLTDLKGCLSPKLNITPQSAMQNQTDYKAVAYFVNWCVSGSYLVSIVQA